MNPKNESYDPRYFEPLFAAEERHFWFVARNKVICALARKILGQRENASILEVGCGTGNVLQALEAEFPEAELVGMDLFQEGLQFARRRVHCGLVQADLSHPPFERTVDLLGMFDVLEHIQDDMDVLSQAEKLIKPGGWLLLTVPSDPKLWSYFDVASHHVRRYSEKELSDKVQENGFKLDFVSPYIAATYPLVWLTRNARENTGSSGADSVESRAEDELKIIPVVNEILRGILSLEAGWLSGRRRLPFGSSLVLMAQKPFILT